MRPQLVVAIALGLALAAPAVGCSSPYSGKAERLKKPKEKKRPPDEEPVAAPVEDAKCKTNFFDEPTTDRNARDGRRLADQGDTLLGNADRVEGDDRTNLVVEALSKLKNSLKKDPYGPEATFKMAVAYAMVGRKSCALALLERLALLQKHPDVEREATRTVQRALREGAFDPFRKDADAALGE